MRILRYALKNILRNRWLSFSSVMVIGLLAFFVNILLLVHFSTEQFISNVNNRIVISLNLNQGFDDKSVRVQAFQSDLRSSFPDMQVKYISSKDAFVILASRNPDLASLIEDETENPLPSSIVIENIRLDAYKNLNAKISTYQDILKYNKDEFDKMYLDYQSQFERIDRVTKILRYMQYGVYVLLALFAFTVFIIIYNVIGNFIFFSQDEIRIIELVGGKPSFIYGPFTIQGGIYAIVAAIFATLLILLVRTTIFPYISDEKEITTLLSRFFGFWDTIIGKEILVFALLGLVSGYLASRKYIRSTIK